MNKLLEALYQLCELAIEEEIDCEENINDDVVDSIARLHSSLTKQLEK